MKLYHGSKIAGIKILKPNKHKVINKEKAVFATPDQRFALSMIHGTGNELAVGYYENTKTKKKVMYVDELKENKLKLLQQPGSLYEVDAKGFKKDKRLMQEELIARKEVQVLSEKIIPNIYNELKKRRVKIVPYERVLEEMHKRKKDPSKAKKKQAKERFL